MTKRRLQRNQNQAQWDAPFTVNGAHCDKYEVTSPGKNDNKPVQKKRFGDSCHEKDSPWWFWCAVVFFTMNTWTTMKRSLPTKYLHISDRKMWLVAGLGSLGHTKIPSPDVAFVCEKRPFFWHRFWLHYTIQKTSYCTLHTILLYTCNCMVGCWMVGSWSGQNNADTTAIFTQKGVLCTACESTDLKWPISWRCTNTFSRVEISMVLSILFRNEVILMIWWFS